MKKLFICKYCGEVMMGDSAKCFHCGRDQRTFFRRYRSYILLAISLVVFIGFLFILDRL